MGTFRSLFDTVTLWYILREQWNLETRMPIIEYFDLRISTEWLTV